MENIDWNSVPDAEYWCDGKFFKTISGEWYCTVQSDKLWRRATEASPAHLSWWSHAIERPPESWSGGGLPPVGIKCEVASDDQTIWHECRILAHHNGKAVMVCEGWNCDYQGCDMDYGAYPAERFRTIRTPEQIAEEERNAAINQMIGFVKDHPLGRLGAHHLGELKIQEDTCRDLYDAGYRKGESK